MPGSRRERRHVYRRKFQVDSRKSPMPRFDLFNLEYYLYPGVQFRAVVRSPVSFATSLNFTVVFRALRHAQILAELDPLYRLGYRGFVDFVDDNLIGNKKL